MSADIPVCKLVEAIPCKHASLGSYGDELFVCINKLQRFYCLQLRDEFGNAVEALDTAVTISLAWPEQQDAAAAGRELPLMEMSERQTQQSDAQGRVFFGDIYIAEGSGRVERGAPDSTMEMDLVFSAASPSG